MGGKEEPTGWGLSSEQYDEDKVLEVDTRSVDYDKLRRQAKDPHATWSKHAEDERDDDAERDTERTGGASGGEDTAG